MDEDDKKRWQQHRDGLMRRIELMKAGKMRTFEGPSLKNDTTAASLKVAEDTLASIERLLARHG